MNNTTITAAIRRNGGGPWAGVRMRMAGALILLCAAIMAFPGVAKAQTVRRGCTSSGGAEIKLIPSVNFDLGAIPPPGAEIYRTQTYVINYECTNYDRLGRPVTASPQLQVLSDYTSLNQAVNRAGLALEIIVNGDESNPWRPNREPGLPISENHDAGLPYTGESGPRALTLIARLKVVNNNPPAARYPVPSGTIFKLIAGVGAVLSPGPFITHNATRMQFVPRCIGDVSVDNLVRFGRIIAMTGYMGTLPQQHPFNVTTRINPSCNIGSLTAPALPDNERTQFLMLLSAQFILQGPGRIDGDGTSIILRNEDGLENGLRMQILDTENANQPVPILPAPVEPLRDDVGNYGQLVGSNPAVVHAYTASLTPDAGKELKLGKYSTQVLVKVTYY